MMPSRRYMAPKSVAVVINPQKVKWLSRRGLGREVLVWCEVGVERLVRVGLANHAYTMPSGSWFFLYHLISRIFIIVE